MRNHNKLFDEHQRFSLRKLTVGLASVLVGVALFGTTTITNSHTVHADEITNSNDSDDEIPEESGLDDQGNLRNENMDVNYGANDQTQTIHYKDDKGDPAKDANGQKIPDGQVTGKTDDQDKTVPMPNGWKPKDPNTDGKTNLDNPDPTTGNVPDKDVTIEHGQHTTAPGETHKKGDPISKDAPGSTDTATQTGPENKYQEDINKEDVTKDLTRTITVNKPTGDVTVDAQGHQTVASTAEDHSETVTYNRNTTVDDVTGKVVSHGDWQLADPAKNKFDAFPVPTVEGYTPNPATIDENQAPTDQNGINNYTDPKIVINYTADNQSVNYVFTDGAKGNVASGTVHGVTDQTVDSKTALADVIKQLTDKGYDMSKVTIDPYKFKAQNGDITIDLANDHGIIKGVDPNPGGSDSNTPGDTTKIPEGLKDTDSHIVTLEDTRKEITRTITANEPTDANENARSDRDLSQHGVVTRTFDYDPVTKTITHWNDWRPVSWSAVTVPEHAGYTATITDGEGGSLTSIDSVTTSDPSYKDPKIVITYKANSQSRNYVFKDGEKTVDQKAVSGVTDQTVDPATQLGDIKSDLESKGYDWSKIDLGGSYKFKASDNTDNVIDLSGAHGFKEVGPDDTIPNGVTDPNKSGSDKHVTNSDVTETVTRHITFHDPTHENSTSTQDRNADQTVTLKRGFTYDTVTSEVTKYGDWTTQAVPAVDVPQVPGYEVAVSGADLQDGKIAGDTLRDGYQDPKIEVTYTAQDSTQTIHYVDKEGHDLTSDDNKDNHGQVIGDSTVTVKTDEVGNVQVPKGWKLVDDHDKTTKVSYGEDGHIPVKTVKIEHDTITVDPSQDHKQGSPIDPQNPNGPKWPEGVTNQDLNAVAYRRITFNLPKSTKAADYAAKLRNSGLEAEVNEKDNKVTVNQTITYHRTAVVDAVTGALVGYNPDNAKHTGWLPIEPEVNATLLDGTAKFKKIIIPQVAGYKTKVEHGTDITRLTPTGRMSLSQLFVSFMALPNSKGFDPNSIGEISGQEVKPPKSSNGSDSGAQAPADSTKPIKDLDAKDKEQAKKGTTPAKPDDHKDNKGQAFDDSEAQKPGSNKDQKPDASEGQQPNTGKAQTSDTSETQKPESNKDQKPDASEGQQPNTGKAQTDGQTASVVTPNEGKSDSHKETPANSDKDVNTNSAKSGKTTAKGKTAKNNVKTNSNANETRTVSKKQINSAKQNKSTVKADDAAVSHENGVKANNNVVQAATVKGSQEHTLPQTGESQNAKKLNIIGLALAGLASLLGLAETKKRRKD